MKHEAAVALPALYAKAAEEAERAERAQQQLLLQLIELPGTEFEGELERGFEARPQELSFLDAFLVVVVRLHHAVSEVPRSLTDDLVARLQDGVCRNRLRGDHRLVARAMCELPHDDLALATTRAAEQRVFRATYLAQIPSEP